MDNRRNQPQAKIILIGVQARSNSTRLPNKALLEIDGKTLTEHVMDSCELAATYLNRNFSRYNCFLKTALLVPNGDPLENIYARKYPVISYKEISEDDVLSRYVMAAKDNKADYIARITGDCIFTASYLISRHIKAAIFGGHDYTSNVWIRTFREGMDVEVISSKLLAWLDKHTTGKDREHVTSILKHRDKVPREFRFCHILNDVDDSHMKTSIDTKDDLDRAIAERDSLHSKRRQALKNGDTVS